MHIMNDIIYELNADPREQKEIQLNTHSHTNSDRCVFRTKLQNRWPQAWWWGWAPSVQEEERIAPPSAAAVTNPPCLVASGKHACSEANLGRASVGGVHSIETLEAKYTSEEFEIGKYKPQDLWPGLHRGRGLVWIWSSSCLDGWILAASEKILVKKQDLSAICLMFYSNKCKFFLTME